MSDNQWATKPLAEVCENLDSKRKPITKSKRIAGPIPYYGVSGVVDHVEDYLFDEDLLLVSEDGANLLARTYPIAFSVSGKTWVNNHAHVLRFPNLDAQRFIEYYLNSISLEPWVSGMAQPKLNQTKLNSIPVPDPPPEEQKRIVSILDEAFSAIAKAKENAEKNLLAARELFESYLNRVFTQQGPGWHEKPLGELAEFKNGLNFNKNSSGQTLPVVGVGDFQDNFYVPMEELETATIDGELEANYAIQKDDILTVRSNGSKHLIGRCMLVPEVFKTTSYSGFVIRIRFDTETLKPRFLLHFMKSSRTVTELTRGGGGANINNINQRKLSALNVTYPTDTKQQERFADALDEVSRHAERLETIYTQKLANLDELKQSLLQKAFTGQLTSNNLEEVAV